MEVSDVLGNARGVEKVYPDGSYNCPFCSYAVRPEDKGCQNPWCVANPSMPTSCARDIYEKERQRKVEEESRRRNHEMAMDRIAEDKRRRQEEIDRAIKLSREEGVCFDCLTSYPPKRIRHRKPENCPKRR